LVDVEIEEEKNQQNTTNTPNGEIKFWNVEGL
jgi:hypothetical protein